MMKKLIFLTICLMFPLILSCQTIRKFNFADGFITQTHFLHNPKTQTWENFKRIEIFVGSLDDAAQSKLNTMSGENHRWGE